MIASAVQRVLIGGHHNMTGDVTLVDAKTGAIIVPGQSATGMAESGDRGSDR